MNMTINMCRRHCLSNSYTYAHLHNGSACLCTVDLMSQGSVIDDSKCTVECSGHSYQVCGGIGTIISTYEGKGCTVWYLGGGAWICLWIV